MQWSRLLVGCYWAITPAKVTKKHGHQIGSKYTDCSLHPYFTYMWTNSDHPSGGRIIWTNDGMVYWGLYAPLILIIISLSPSRHSGKLPCHQWRRIWVLTTVEFQWLSIIYLMADRTSREITVLPELSNTFSRPVSIWKIRFRYNNSIYTDKTVLPSYFHDGESFFDKAVGIPHDHS